MLTNLHNGDRITVQIVDKEKRSVTVGDTAQSIPIIYPTVDTGLVSYVENEKIARTSMYPCAFVILARSFDASVIFRSRSASLSAFLTS